MIDFSIKSSGFDNVIDNQRSVQLNWDLKAMRQAKSVEYENRYSQLYYQYDDGDTNYLSSYSDSDKKYFYMNDLTDKFVCAHCMHACRIHACRILSIFSTHLTVLVPMLPVSGYTLRMYRYLGWPISATSLSSGWNSHSEPEFQPVSAKLVDLGFS